MSIKVFFKRLLCFHCYHEYNLRQIGDFYFIHDIRCCICGNESTRLDSIVENIHD